MRVIVAVLSLVLIVPSLVLTPITYIIFGYPICSAVMIIGTNAFTYEGDWNYKEIFDCV